MVTVSGSDHSRFVTSPRVADHASGNGLPVMTWRTLNGSLTVHVRKATQRIPILLQKNIYINMEVIRYALDHPSEWTIYRDPMNYTKSHGFAPIMN